MAAGVPGHHCGLSVRLVLIAVAALVTDQLTDEHSGGEEEHLRAPTRSCKAQALV
jgi:hypothetical protein